MKKIRLLTVALTTFATVAGAPGLMAQPHLEEVVVTARKKTESLQDVPISITVMSGDVVQNQGYRDLQTVTENLSAVTVARGGANEFMYIRGIGSGANSGYEQSVGFVVDGISIGRSRATRSGFVDLDRIEVLKGPQTTYFGANTTAGVINMTTKSATLDDELDAFLRASYEIETEQFVIEGATDIPVSDTFGLRIAGKYSDSEGYLENTFLNVTRPANEDTVLRVSALWQPTDTFSAELKTTYGTLDSNSGLDLVAVACVPFSGPASGGPAQFNCIGRSGQRVGNGLGYTMRADLPEERTLEYVTSVLTMNFDIGDYTLTSVTGFYDQESVFTLDLDLSDVPSAITVSRFGNQQHDYADQTSQELRLSSPSGGKMEWTIGAYFQEENIDFDQAAVLGFSPPAPRGAQSGFFNDQEATTLSAFGTVTANLSDNLRATLGLRYVEVDKTITRSITFNGPIPASGTPEIANLVGFGPIPFETRNRKDDDLLASLDLQYDLSEGVNVYGSYTQGFKAGAYSMQNTLQGIFTDFIETVGPETVDAAEVGMKGIFLDNRLRANIAIFRAVYEDLQVSTVLPTPPGATAGLFIGFANADEAVAQGLEFDFAAQLSESFALLGEFTYLDSSYADFPNAPCFSGQTASQGCVPNPAGPGTGQSLDDQDNPFSPKYAGSLALRYTQPIGDYELTIEPSVFYTDSYFLQADLDPNHTQESYSKLNLRVALGQKSGNWEVAFVGRNLNDELTTNFCQDVPAGTIGSYTCAPDAPATYALQGRINF